MFLSPCNAERAGAQREQPADARDDRPQRAHRLHHRQGGIQSGRDQVKFTFLWHSSCPPCPPESSFCRHNFFCSSNTNILTFDQIALSCHQYSSFQIEVSLLTFAAGSDDLLVQLLYLYFITGISIFQTRFDPFRQILHRKFSEGKLYICIKFI